MGVTHSAIAVLKLPRRNKEVGPFANSIVTAMTGNASFPTPNPALAVVSADIVAYENAEVAVLARTKGAAETRDVKLVTLRTDLEHLVAYVQVVADGDPSTAEAVIQSAGLAVKRHVAGTKGALEVEPAGVPGAVKLLAKAAAQRAAYEWQFGTDQKTWTNAPTTLQAKTAIVGLTSATTYYFRCRAVTKGGEGAWTQVVALVVS
jgi:hypothetical protein